MSSTSTLDWATLTLVAICTCTLVRTTQLSPSPPDTSLQISISDRHLLYANVSMIVTSTMFGVLATRTKKPAFMIMAMVTYFEYINTVYQLFGLGLSSLFGMVLYSSVLCSTGWQICQKELLIGVQSDLFLYYDRNGKAHWMKNYRTDGAISL
ncbi:MAG: hypothetical protein J3R72DRAFT_530067 [Linnemannia gamsii]|nr:MAG: hypothetical protein J3R72DRAFT_530067 [Linnemannia gamsii]